MKQYFIVGVFSTLILFWMFGNKGTYEIKKEATTSSSSVVSVGESRVKIEEAFADEGVDASASTSATGSDFMVTHLETPKDVKAIYVSSWVASTPSARQRLVSLVKDTELNAMVVDVKDNTGAITWEDRMKEDDLKNFIEELHANNIYVIGRVAVFQDPAYAKAHKDQAVQRADGTLWKSRKGEAWVDTGSKQMWDYVISVSKKAHSFGFDEINLDYIRFSTEGFNEGLIFPESKSRGKTDRVGVVKEFYKYVTGELRAVGIPVSGDVFGIITTSSADIPVLGQDFHNALLYFDYVAPMVYPSHYAAGTFGYSSPAAHPSEVIREALKGAVNIADEVASSTGQATSSVRGKIRPWYQDFDMGAVYTKEMVRGQITAGERLGVDSWMLWDPSNKYTPSALLGQ